MDDYKSEHHSKHATLSTRRVCFKIPDINRFSKYYRLDRATAWLLRYVQKLLRKIKAMDTIKGELTMEEEALAEVYLCRHAQQQTFAKKLLTSIRKAS